MGNKFTQSVLQRLEQEQKVQTKSKAQTKTITKKPEEPKKNEELPVKNMEYPNIEQSSAIESKEMPDISEYLRLEPARTAKNKTFYLDVEVIKALCAAARRQNVTDSKLCNDILRRVLGIGGING